MQAALERCHVGNDVVDLACCGVLPRARFVERICGPSELVRRGPLDAGLFWALFAAKEAAFKALSKSSRALSFVPRDFWVGPELTSVWHGTRKLELELTFTPDWVHALVTDGSAATAWTVAALAAGEEESEGARRLLRELAAGDLGCPSSELEVIRVASQSAWDGRGPPRLHVRGKPARMDVSLSHDGRFAACAIAGTTP